MEEELGGGRKESSPLPSFPFLSLSLSLSSSLPLFLSPSLLFTALYSTVLHYVEIDHQKWKSCEWWEAMGGINKECEEMEVKGATGGGRGSSLFSFLSFCMYLLSTLSLHTHTHTHTNAHSMYMCITRAPSRLHEYSLEDFRSVSSEVYLIADRR